MATMVVEAQRDSFSGTELGADGSTWFVPCGDDEASVFAVVDAETGELVGDCLTRRHAEEMILRLAA